MSTVGLGIVYHQNTSGSSTNPPVTTQPDVTTTPVTTTTAAPATTPAVSETQPTTDYEYGDINRDKVVEMTDLTLLSQYLLGDIKLDPQQILLADVNGDGGTDIADLSHFKQYILKEPVKLGPQK